MQNQIPNHVLHADYKTRRRQRKSYIKAITRVGINGGGNNNLSCIEPEVQVQTTSAEKPRDFRLQQNQKNVNPLSKDNNLLPWLGGASKSLMTKLQSSRILDIFGTRDSPPPKKNDTDKSIGAEIRSEAIMNINASLASAGHLYKTYISDGFGKLIYPNGTIYIGSLESDLPHGVGKALYTGGATYEGEWNTGNKEGQGILTFSDGSYYEGSFMNKFHGEGTFVSPSLGIVYSGHFSAGCVYGEYSVWFSRDEHVQRCWPDARLTLHEAVNKLAKERKGKAKRRPNKSNVPA